MITLPKKSLFYLAVACASGFMVYVALFVSALYFASSTTEYLGIARATEADVVALETEYYIAIQKLTKTNPEELGYVTPRKVVYVEVAGAPALSRAER